MKKAFKWVAILVMVYIGVNWIADNPQTMRVVRKKMNIAVEEGIEGATVAAKQAQEAVKQELDK